MYTTKHAYAINFDRKSEAETYVVDLLRKWAQAGEELSKKGDSVRHALAWADDRLDADQHVNSLGELQSTAHDFDRLCAVREARAEELVKTTWLLVRTGAIPEARLAELLAGTPFAINPEEAAR